MSMQSIKSALAWLYGVAVKIHQPGVSKVRAEIPVISVGNLEVGGTGKSPIAQALFKSLRGYGYKPAIFSRGYGGYLKGPVKVNAQTHHVSEVGDEALMHAKNGFDCYVCGDRAKAIKFACSDGINVAVLDDGHATKSIVKDYCILVFRPGFSVAPHLLPAGRLREPLVKGLTRADSVIINGSPSAEDETLLRSMNIPFITGDFKVEASPNSEFQTLVTAIANPRRVLQSAQNAGWNIDEHLIFPDHHKFSKADIQKLSRLQAILTTEKDCVKLPPNLQKKVQILRGHWQANDETAYQNLLQRLLKLL